MNPCIVDFLQCWCRRKRKPTSEFWSHSPLTCGTSVFHAPFLFLCYFFYFSLFFELFHSPFLIRKEGFFFMTVCTFMLHFGHKCHFFCSWYLNVIPAALCTTNQNQASNKWGRLRIGGVLANECMTTEDADNVNVAVGRTYWSCQRESVPLLDMEAK